MDRRIAARIALDGATPYAFEDLAYDIRAHGDQTFVAAVARETLVEAEAFAAQNKFQPVCAVAAPSPDVFPGEPFFGVSALASKLGITDADALRDAVAVVEIGDIEVPPGPVVPESEPAPAEELPVEAAEPEPEPPVEDTAPPAPAEEAPAPITGFSSRRANGRNGAGAAAKPAAESVQPAPQNAEPEPAEPAEVFVSARRADPPPAPPVAAPAAASPEPAAAPPAAGVALRTPADVPAAPSLGAAQRRPEPPIADDVIDDLAGLDTFDDPLPDIEPAAIPGPPAAAPVGFNVSSRIAGLFASRRERKATAPEPVAAAGTATAIAADPDEARRMTVFGARKPADAQRVGGKPRYLGLVLTALLLVFLLGVAAWASIFVDDGLARWFGNREPVRTATAPEAPQIEELAPAPAAEPEARLAALDTGDAGLSAEDQAVLDVLGDRQPQAPVAPSLEELEARYAVTGIWPVAPEFMEPPRLIPLDDFYLTSIDPISPAQDALALPAARGLQTDIAMLSPSSPAPFSQTFDLDARGLVRATPEGALTPDGIRVFLGAPPLRPPQTPPRIEVDEAIAALAAFRPKSRPGALQENQQRASLGGLTRSELASYRPLLRPAAETPVTAPQTAETAVNPIPGLVAARPNLRPKNIDRIVARATRAPSTSSGGATGGRDGETRVASVAPRTVTPSIPTRTSVAREATVRNAINLNRMNLIGVYGTPSSRRALVRLANGRYKKVKVGDRIDGGRVSAIGDGELRYVKNNRNLVLKMPKG